MKLSRLHAAARRSSGFTLMEVMIALTAGILLLGALAYLFIGSRQLNRTQDDVTRMQESGRVALEILGRTIRQAGARSDVTAAFASNALAATEGVNGAPDTLTIGYDAQEGGEVNCLGNTVATGPVVSVFAVDTVARTLTCTDGTGAAAVVVMDNVENMQITYAIDSDHDGVIESYQKAAALTTPSAKEVAAVRVSLLVSGPTPNITATHTQTYTYDGAQVTKTDGWLRQVYTSTFTVRNQAK